jgi:hypothetical protein
MDKCQVFRTESPSFFNEKIEKGTGASAKEKEKIILRSHRLKVARALPLIEFQLDLYLFRVR